MNWETLLSHLKKLEWNDGGFHSPKLADIQVEQCAFWIFLVREVETANLYYKVKTPQACFFPRDVNSKQQTKKGRIVEQTAMDVDVSWFFPHSKCRCPDMSQCRGPTKPWFAFDKGNVYSSCIRWLPHQLPCGFVWKCWVYSQWNSHLIGIMISKTIGFFGVHNIFRHILKEWGMSPMMQRYMKSQTTSGAQDSAFAIGSRNQAHGPTIPTLARWPKKALCGLCDDFFEPAILSNMAMWNLPMLKS